MESYENDFGYSDTTTVSAVMVSLQNAGAFISALSISFISERFGRRKTLMFACAVFCVGMLSGLGGMDCSVEQALISFIQV